MRALIYLSNAVESGDLAFVPYDYINVFEECRTRVARYNLTGVFSYIDGCFIHCLEGSDNDIANVIYWALTSQRRNHFKVLLNKKTSTRVFRSWRMLPVPILRADSSFNRFVQAYTPSFRKLDDTDEKLISSIIA